MGFPAAGAAVGMATDPAVPLAVHGFAKGGEQCYRGRYGYMDGGSVTDLVGQTSKEGPPPGFGIGVNNYLNHYVNVADAKAAGILTADFTLSGYLVTHVPSGLLPLASHWVALILLIASGVMALRVLYPRTPKIGSSLIFWEDIRSREMLETYLADLRHTEEAEVERQYGAQNYLVSGVLSKKYVSVRGGMKALMGAIPFVILRIILG